jgi:D-alanine transaminase
VIVHLNGKLVPHEQATIGVFDRGFIFGDGVYEGLRSFGGRTVFMDRHIRRMQGGLDEARIPWDAGQLTPLTEQLLDANGLEDAFIYWQVTRGTPTPGRKLRSRVLDGPCRPTVFGYCIPTPALDEEGEPRTVDLALASDTRWSRGHLKSTSLLGNVIAAVEADERGAADALLLRGDLVAEATASNVFLAAPGGTVVTPSLESVSILGGVTRAVLIEADPAIVEREVRREELGTATEAMLVGTVSMVTSVVSIDGRPVGSGEHAGRVGPEARRLSQALLRAIRRDLGLEANARTETLPAQVGAGSGAEARNAAARA